uniref:Uncharacterized protein n=1 Tax=Leersia perrieri TaxID=77586 RepID=A0A0D9XIK1_9ORYZ
MPRAVSRSPPSHSRRRSPSPRYGSRRSRRDRSRSSRWSTSTCRCMLAAARHTGRTLVAPPHRVVAPCMAASAGCNSAAPSSTAGRRADALRRRLTKPPNLKPHGSLLPAST